MRQLLTGATLAVFCCGAAFSQQAPRLTFEVADIQVHTETDQQPSANLAPGGRVDIRNLPMKQLILIAYNVGQGVADKLIEGIPGWADSERFDIIAKGDPKSSVSIQRLMLKSLLEDRFKLATHTEEKVMPVFALLPGKGAPKITPAESKDPFTCNGGAGSVPNMIHLNCSNVTMADLVKSLPTFAPRYFDSPVVNATEIQGSYDLMLEWSPLPGPAGNGSPAAGSGTNVPQHATATDGADIPAATIFDAVQALGFKLEKRKMPYPVVIVDHLEKRPTEN